jgi:hypothetical protein
MAVRGGKCDYQGQASSSGNTSSYPENVAHAISSFTLCAKPIFSDYAATVKGFSIDTQHGTQLKL